MSNKIYAAESELSLVRLSEEDKENYMKLRRQVTASPILYDNLELAAIMWEFAIEGDEREDFYYILTEKLRGNNIIQLCDVSDIGSKMGAVIERLHLAFNECESQDEFKEVS